MPKPSRPWFRIYSESLDSPKLQRLSPAAFKGWFNLTCLANITEPRGTLPPLADVAFRLRMADKQAETLIAELVEARLLDETDSGFAIHDWDGPDGWQYESDARATDGRRMRGDTAADAPRKTQQTAADAPPRADTDTDTDTDTEQRRADTDPARAALRPDLDDSDETGFALEYIQRYEQKNARPPSPNEKAAARSLERDFGTDTCRAIAADHDWQRHPNWLREALSDPNRGKRIQTGGGSYGHRPKPDAADELERRIAAL